MGGGRQTKECIGYLPPGASTGTDSYEYLPRACKRYYNGKKKNVPSPKNPVVTCPTARLQCPKAPWLKTWFKPRALNFGVNPAPWEARTIRRGLKPNANEIGYIYRV